MSHRIQLVAPLRDDRLGTGSAAADAKDCNSARQLLPVALTLVYAEAGRLTGRPGSEFLVQHLREVAIDHTNGIFAGTNDLVEWIGGRSPMTVEAFVTKHRQAFEA